MRIVKPMLLLAVCAGLFFSCSTLEGLGLETLPLSKRLVSENKIIRQAAVAEFTEADENKKKKTVMEIIEMFAVEKDEDKRKRMLSVLTDIDTGSYAVIPLLRAAGRNADVTSVGGIVDAVKKMKPSASDINRMGVMFMEGTDIMREIIKHFIGRF